MGTAKQLLPWGETTVLGQTIRNVQQADVDDLLLVTGHRADEVRQIGAETAVSAIHNPYYATGEMLSSLQVAVAHLQHRIDAVLVVLADQPMVESETYSAIIAPFRAKKSQLIAPTYKGRRGNPVLIGTKYFPELLALPQGEAPRTLLKRHKNDLLLVPVPTDTIHRDLDTPEAYNKWRPHN